MRIHPCPWCRCRVVDVWDGQADKSAPFYGLVVEVDALFGTFRDLGAGRGRRYRTGGPT